MKTTALVVEHVLIGGILLAIIALPLYPEIAAISLPESSSASITVVGISASAVLLGIVYLTGIVFDRLADSILEPWERHIRLRFALKRASWPRPWSDPFPEGAYRVAVLIQGGAVSEWMDYLRTRVRLARSLALFLPGLTLALQAAVSRCHGTSCALGGACRTPAAPAVGDWRAWLAIGLPALYLLAPCVAWCCGRLGLLSKVVPGIWKPPKTDDDRSRVKDYAKARGLPSTDGAGLRANLIDVCLGAPFLLFGVSLGVAAWIFAALPTAVPLAAIPLFGFGFAALSAWAWWRMQRTFLTYLRQIGEAL